MWTQLHYNVRINIYALYSYLCLLDQGHSNSIILMRSALANLQYLNRAWFAVNIYSQ
jgi:hypothetical protein